MPWWAWILAGLALLGLELLSGTFFLLFLGAAALLIGLFAVFGGSGPLWMEWLLFFILSAALVFLLRRPLLGRFRIESDPRDIDALVGGTAVASESIPPGEIGKVEMRGTSWSARNAGQIPLAAGQRCVVTGVQGLSLAVRAESSPS